MDEAYGFDTYRVKSQGYYTYRARAELIVQICHEIQAAMAGLPSGRSPHGYRFADVHQTGPFRRHVELFVQQLARMEELARQLMDHAVAAEALGAGHME